jgi:hypothetical protein
MMLRMQLSRSKSKARHRDGVTQGRCSKHWMRRSSDSLSQWKFCVTFWWMMVLTCLTCACVKSRTERKPHDLAWKEPGRRPNVGALHFHNTSQLTASPQPKEPRLSLVLPSDANVNLIESPEDRISPKLVLLEMHSRCSNSGHFH